MFYFKEKTFLKKRKQDSTHVDHIQRNPTPLSYKQCCGFVVAQLPLILKPGLQVNLICFVFDSSFSVCCLIILCIINVPWRVFQFLNTCTLHLTIHTLCCCYC